MYPVVVEKILLIQRVKLMPCIKQRNTDVVIVETAKTVQCIIKTW